MARSCGACNLCCKLLRIPDIDKPSGMLCWWTTIHGGCQRQAEKPKDPLAPVEGEDPALAACAQFRCLWLDSQRRANPGEVMPRHWRPDISRVVMGPKDRDDDRLIYIHVDPATPSAWKDPEIYGYLQRMVERGGKIEIVIGEDHFRLDSERPS